MSFKEVYYQQQEQQRQNAINQAMAQEAQAKADADAKNAALRTSASGAARTSASRFFQDRGLDPNQFTGNIDDKINEILNSTAGDDQNIGSYLSNIGQSVYDNQLGATRQKSLRDVNNIFTPDYANSRINDTLDDPILADINTQQRGKADDFVNNLFKRGVINDTGRQGAERNLDEQSSHVMSILNDLGKGTLDTGRQQLTDIANRGRGAASTLDIGQSFDPNAYRTDSDQAFNDFISNLGTSIKGKLPGDLYDTSGLAAVAGGAQGAQNFKFDPNALAGIIGQGKDGTQGGQDEEDNAAKKKKFAPDF